MPGLPSLLDLFRPQGGSGQPVRAIGQGGSRNPFAPQGYGQGSPMGFSGVPADMDMKWLGDNIGRMGAISTLGGRGYAQALATSAGTRTGANMPAYQAPPPRQPLYGGGWDGMRRNIGWGPPSNGLAGLAGMFGGAAGGQPQRSPFGGGGMAGGSLAQLLAMFGGGGGY